ncbi:kinase-like protein [Neolentinus lepideus HHB14362 ss-1]|uniref:Kinase-like protein n=1 Tax=Neolentinus lepideus HHB14362 ss-1 TaxID=1314782 RepID=A0A165PH15_9AGAM|nr:kinase-like protein [Neolentinus lepideus HHB14362 ss-1]
MQRTISISPSHERSDFMQCTGQMSSCPTAFGASSDIYMCEFEQGKMMSGILALKCYRATDERKRLFGDDVATKVGMVHGPDQRFSVPIQHFLQQLHHDLYFSRTLRHPNIVTTYGHTTCFGGKEAIVMAWYDQGTAPEYIAKRPGTSIRQMLLDAIEGVTYLHGMGIVHGNLRGSSVLVDKDGKTVIAGLGQAELLVSHLPIPPCARCPAEAPSVHYSAPEIVQGARRTFASDIWALGCTLFELLTGRKPYSGYRHLQIPLAIAQGRMPGIFEESDQTDEVQRMRPIIEACWTEDPMQRPKIREIRQMMLVSSASAEA